MKSVDRRVAMFKVTPQFLLDVALNQSDFADRYPGAERIAIAYDFEIDCFKIKFRHASLEQVDEGGTIPLIDPPRFVDTPKPWWKFWRFV